MNNPQVSPAPQNRLRTHLLIGLLALALIALAMIAALKFTRGSPSLARWTLPSATALWTTNLSSLTAQYYRTATPFKEVTAFYDERVGLEGTRGDPMFTSTSFGIPFIRFLSKQTCKVRFASQDALEIQSHVVFELRDGDIRIARITRPRQAGSDVAITLAAAALAESSSDPFTALEYPSAQSGSGGSVRISNGDIKASRYRTTDPFDEVRAFYERKLQAPEPARDPSEPGDESTIPRRLAIPGPTETGAQMAGFITIRENALVYVELIRNENENTTHILLSRV
jgi:hypothetical protein